jgi:hypothetical protein
MDAGQVAGLLVLLGVVGVLAAIVGSGVEAGPVKFPSIPSSRQKLLAITSIAVVVGGVVWWVVQQHQPTQSAADGVPASVPSGGLRVSLVPAGSNIQVGHRISVAVTVSDASGGTLGAGQCTLRWRDEVKSRAIEAPTTTTCAGPFTEVATRPGVHHVTATAEGINGTQGGGSGSVDVTVTQ